MYTDKENEYAIELWESTSRLFGPKHNVELSMLGREEERIGQFATWRLALQMQRALKAARLERSRTGAIHHISFTITFRDLIPRLCWTVVLGAGA